MNITCFAKNISTSKHHEWKKEIVCQHSKNQKIWEKKRTQLRLGSKAQKTPSPSLASRVGCIFFFILVFGERDDIF